MDRDKVVSYIYITTILTLSIVIVSVAIVLLSGLFEDNVNNDKIFEMLGPAFNTIVGAFVGLLGGLSLGQKSDDQK